MRRMGMPTIEKQGTGLSALAALALSLGATGCGGGDTAKHEPHVLASGEIGTWAGTGLQGSNGDGNQRLETWLNQPMELAFSPADDTAYVVDWNNHCVRHVTKTGTFENVIGTPDPGDWPCQVPGDPKLCATPLTGEVPGDQLSLNHPMDVAFKDGGGFYLAAWHDHKIESYDADTKNVSVLAGLQKPGPAVPPTPPVTTPPTLPGPGDGSPAAKAPLNFPSSIVVQSDGSVLVSDERNNRVRRIEMDDDVHTISTVAGSAAATGQNADGIAATTALLNLTTSEKISGADNPPPGGAIALDADGNLYIADTYHHAIRKVLAGADGVVTGDTDETISTVAGTLGTAGYSGDGGAATAATLKLPFDIEFGPDGFLYIADTENHVVRRADLSKDTIETIAGTGKPGFSGDDGPATKAELREPYGLAFDKGGDLYVADTINNRIRRIAR